MSTPSPDSSWASFDEPSGKLKLNLDKIPAEYMRGDVFSNAIIERIAFTLAKEGSRIKSIEIESENPLATSQFWERLKKICEGREDLKGRLGKPGPQDSTDLFATPNISVAKINPPTPTASASTASASPGSSTTATATSSTASASTASSTATASTSSTVSTASPGSSTATSSTTGIDNPDDTVVIDLNEYMKKSFFGKKSYDYTRAAQEAIAQIKKNPQITKVQVDLPPGFKNFYKFDNAFNEGIKKVPEFKHKFPQRVGFTPNPDGSGSMTCHFVNPGLIVNPSLTARASGVKAGHAGQSVSGSGVSHPKKKDEKKDADPFIFTGVAQSQPPSRELNTTNAQEVEHPMSQGNWTELTKDNGALFDKFFLESRGIAPGATLSKVSVSNDMIHLAGKDPQKNPYDLKIKFNDGKATLSGTNSPTAIAVMTEAGRALARFELSKLGENATPEQREEACTFTLKKLAKPEDAWAITQQMARGTPPLKPFFSDETIRQIQGADKEFSGKAQLEKLIEEQTKNQNKPSEAKETKEHKEKPRMG